MSGVIRVGPDADEPAEQWLYTIEEEADPRRITLTKGDKTIKAIVWASSQQMVITLAIERGDFPEGLTLGARIILPCGSNVMRPTRSG